MNETINRLIAFERRSRWEEYISSINGHTPTGDLWKTIKRLTNKQPITTNLQPAAQRQGVHQSQEPVAVIRSLPRPSPVTATAASSSASLADYQPTGT